MNELKAWSDAFVGETDTAFKVVRSVKPNKKAALNYKIKGGI